MRTTTLFAVSAVFAAACAVETSSTEQLLCESWEAETTATLIWPPDHTLRSFTLDDCVAIVETECPGGGDDDGLDKRDPDGPTPFTPTTASATSLSITSITSDELIDAKGDGSTDHDAAILDAVTFELRAERSGGGNGRVYHVNFVDAVGATGTCDFVVPHDTGNGAAVDDGAASGVTR